jgi:type I restriction enzyme, S subunit
MSSVNFMEKLLDGVAVEWKSLGEVLTIKNGKDYKSFQAGSIPVYGTGGIMAFIDTPVFDKPSVLIPRKGSLANLYYVDVPFWTVDTIFWTDINTRITEPKFVYYYLKTQHLEELNMAGGVPSLTQTILNKVPFPIPCPDNPKKSLEIQGEIVRILDTFTELTAELTAELKARKKQYNYYRDQLLNFEEEFGTTKNTKGTKKVPVEWKTLGEVAENLDALRKPVTSGLREVGKIPYYGASGIVDYVKYYIFDGDYLLVSEDGANLVARNTPIAFSISGKSWVNNHAHVLKFNTYAERRFVEYYLNSIDLTPYISGAAQPKLNQKNLNGIKIPNPSPFEKEKIVAILDKFDALTTSITEGLPREIELRQKQYEYYRNLLLTFPREA